MHITRFVTSVPVWRPYLQARLICGAAAAIVVPFLWPHVGLTQEPEVVLSKDAISVHRVERGTMVLRESAKASVSSLVPARAQVRLTPQQSALVRVGQSCAIQIVPPSILHGRVSRVRKDRLADVTIAELEFSGDFAPGTSVNDSGGALLDVGTAQNVVFFERPASAQPSTTSTIFVLEPDGKHAKRVTVVYGRLSGSQLEILSGLAPGDRVIVTDLPALAGHDRVALK